MDHHVSDAQLVDSPADAIAYVCLTGRGTPAHQSSEPATKLREAVMSPKGTTIEALAVLMAPNGLQQLMTKAIAAATERGRQIAAGK